jgi:hypothetical protein
MDKWTFCNNYLYSYGQVIFIIVDNLSLLWCLFVSEDMCVDYPCMSKWKQWEMDRVDLSMRTDSKETMINTPPSHLFTDATLPLHSSWVLSDYNYWALKLVTSRYQCSSVTNFIARYQYGVISNRLKQPVTIGCWSVTDFTSSLPKGLTCVTGSI